jgi:eukaryotic-like serine/threonine-protein kinase
MDSPRKDPLLGTQVGEYVVEERIGIGGMGVVYRASQKRIGKTVAIKVLRAEVMEDPREMERFLDEAKAVNAISHRGIISIFGSGELADGRQYLVMEYLKGEGLDAKLKREGRVPAADLIPILEEIAGALQGCHNAGIVHRDLKPGNVFLVDQDDGKPWVKLLDFGLARRGERTDVSRIAGTPDYLSPEHSRGLPAGPPSDLYSLGVMAFQLLTGRLPFNGRTPLEVMEKHVYDDPPHPVLFEPSIPDALNQLVLQLMRKEPAQRPQMLEVKALLKQAAKQSRSASTQPGEVLDPADVLRARASAEALEAASAPTPLPGDSGLQGGVSAPTPAVLPLFDELPRALDGRQPGDSGNQGTPSSPAVSPRQAQVVMKAQKQSKALVIGLAVAGLVAVGLFMLVRIDSQAAQHRDRRAGSGSLMGGPKDAVSRPLVVPREVVDMPRLAEPLDDSPIPNPAAAEQPDGG